MNLKRIVEQAEATIQYYDLGRDFSSFTRAMDMTTEQVKNRFEQAIAAKLNGKKIRARASRGYKQFEKDYEINVVNVSLDDYYDNYVVVARGADGKEYFLKPGFKVQILGAAEAEKQEAEPEKKQLEPPKPQPPQQSQLQQLPQQTPQATPQQTPQGSVKEIDGDGETEIVKKYPIEAIEKDLQSWLPRLLMTRVENLKQYIPQHGVSRTKGRRTVVSYGVAIPITDIPGLTADQIKHELSQASRFDDIEKLYTLEKFDVRNGKYVIIIKMITNY